MGCWDSFTNGCNSIQGRLTDGIMTILNFVACGLIITNIVFRFFKLPSYGFFDNLFFFILTFYLGVFILILIWAEFRN